MSRINIPRSRLIVMGVGALVGGLVLWFGANAVYFKPRAALLDEIDRLDDDLETLDKAPSIRISQEDELDALAAQTLGGDREAVDHRLRTHLNRVGEDIGLQKLTVGTSRFRALDTPNRKAFRRQKALRDRIDFALLEGRISGEGNLEQVLRLMHRLHAEPWLKHIDSVRLDADKDGKRFAVAISLTTMFLPGRAPAEPVEWVYDASGFDRYLALAQTNPFAIPEKPQPVVTQAPRPPKQSPPKRPPRFVYGQWQVTFVGQIGDSAEVWLMNTKSGETRRLLVGETLHEAKLVAARADSAEFQLDQKHFAVAVGWTLDDRTPVNR